MKELQKWAFIVGLALAGQARAADGGAPGNHTGAVVDEKGLPVAGATVDCYNYPTSEGFGYRDREPEFTQRTVTDSNGVFAVASAPGVTLAVVRKAGLATTWKTWSHILPDSPDPLVLTAPTALAGGVVDENNQPVAGAQVWVTEAFFGDEYTRGPQENQLFGKPARAYFSARTAADGRFRIEGFPADVHAGLAVSKEGKAQRPFGSGFEGSRDHQSGDEDIELMVGPAGAVEGRVVVAETGEALGGVRINLEGTESGLYGSEYRETTMSTADGAFRIPDLQPGTYTVTPFVPGRPAPDWVVSVVKPENAQVTVVAGETARDVVVQASKGALVQVSVVMTNQGMLLADVPVSSGYSTVYTGINGMALFRAPLGKNWFSARQGWWRQTRTPEIVAGRVNYVWIDLIPPPTITGTVRDTSSASVAGALVSFHPGRYPDAPDYTEVRTDKDGRYEIVLKLSREDYYWEGPISPTNFILARSVERNLAAIQEFDEFPTNLDLDLHPGITLSGSVKDPGGAPVTNATVDLRLESAYSSAVVGPPPIKVNEQGAFVLPAMPQGRPYYFSEGITAKGYGTMHGYYLKAEDTRTNRYEFPAFVLKRADRRLAGQVVGLDGKPVAGAAVQFSGDGQLRWNSHSVKSGRDGRFGFDAVCEGPIQVSANLNSQRGAVAAQGGDTNIIVKLGRP